MKFIGVFFFCSLFLNIHAQHQWVRTNPGGGGTIATVGATVSGTILAASDLSGIYRSNDNGQSWDVIGANQGLDETHISSFGFDPNDEDTYFAGTYIGAYKTSDGGEHFRLVFPDAGHAFDYSYIEDIAIAASNSNVGYLTHHPDPEADGAIYKTTDGGESWHAIPGNNLPTDLHLIKIMIHPTDENMVYVLSGKSRWGCGEANLYRSTDGGVHWTEIGAAQGDILDMDLHPADVNTVFISTFLSTYQDNPSCRDLSLEEYLNEDETAGAFYKSTDGGNSFVQLSDKTGIISVGINNPNTIRLLDVLFPYEWNNDNTGTWETTDGGNTWTHTGFRTNWQQGYSENEYYAFSTSFNGYNKTVTKDIFNADRYYGSFGQWAWASFDGGVTLNNVSTQEISPNHWLSTGVENLNGHCLDINENNPNVVYMGSYDVGFWYTTDHGNSWTRTQPNYNTYPEYSWDLGTPPIEENTARRGAGSNVMTLLNDPDRENVVWASFSKEQYSDPNEGTLAQTGLFKSTNYGEDWTLITNGLPAYAQSILMYGLSLDINSPINNRTLYLTVNGNIYQSTTDGNSWQLVLNNGGLKFTEVDKLNGNIVYAGGKNGLWRSIDGGASWSDTQNTELQKVHNNIRPDIVPTWTDWSGGQPTYEWEGVFDIQTDPNIANRVYVTVMGPGKGLYRSDDAGLNWTKLITDDDMRGVAIASVNSNIVYATSSQSYHSGGFGNSKGILYSTDAGATWNDANDGMAYNYGGMIEIETGTNPHVWAWSPGTGIQEAEIPAMLLPVSYTRDFSARLQGKVVELIWQTSQEDNNEAFVIERSANRKNWVSIGKVMAKNQTCFYKSIDQHPLKSWSFYRLKQIDKNGNFSYSKVMPIQFSEAAASITLFPNPGKEKVHIKSNLILKDYIITNSNGLLVQKGKIQSNYIDISNLATGLYFIEISNIDTKVHEWLKLVKMD